MVKTRSLYLTWASIGTNGSWQTDGQTGLPYRLSCLYIHVKTFITSYITTRYICCAFIHLLNG